MFKGLGVTLAGERALVVGGRLGKIEITQDLNNESQHSWSIHSQVLWA